MIKTAGACATRGMDWWQRQGALDFRGRLFFKPVMNAKLLASHTCCLQKVVKAKKLCLILFQSLMEDQTCNHWVGSLRTKTKSQALYLSHERVKVMRPSEDVNYKKNYFIFFMFCAR